MRFLFSKGLAQRFYRQHACKTAENIRRLVSWKCSIKKVFFKMSQNSQENTFARACCSLEANFRFQFRFLKYFSKNLRQVKSLIIKTYVSLQLYQKETLTRLFPFKFWKIFKSIYFAEHCKRLILKREFRVSNNWWRVYEKTGENFLCGIYGLTKDIFPSVQSR